MQDGPKPLRQRLLVAALTCLIAATGCGQKAALYLPDDPSVMQTVDPGAGGNDNAEDEADGENDETDPEQ